MLRSLIVSVLVLLPTAAAAQTIFDPRTAGMGGVGAAFSDDSTALFENPAGLARIEEWRAEIIATNVMISDALTLAPERIDTLLSQSDENEDAQQAANDLIGDNITASATLFPNFTMKNFGVGLVINGGADMRPRNQAYPRIEGDAKLNADLVVGGAYSFVEDALSVGALVTMGKRAQFADNVGVADAAGDYRFRSLVQEGFGMNYSFGAQVVGPSDWAPRFTILVRNAFGYNFSDPAPIFEGESSELSINDIDPEFLIGGGFSKEFGPLRLRFAVVDDNVATGEQFFLHLFAGTEAILYDILAARIGLWQGYFTAGIGFDFRYLRIEAATFSVERGAFAGQHEDRRWVFQVVLGI